MDSLRQAADIGYAYVQRPYGFDSDDVVQETAARVLEKGWDLADVDLPLLVTIAKGVAVDLVRRNSRQGQDAVPSDEPYPDATTDPADFVVASESARELYATSVRYARGLMRNLTEQEEAAAEAYYLQGLEQAEAGKALGLTRNAVKQALARARDKMGQEAANDLLLLRMHYWHPDARTPQGGLQATPSTALRAVLQYSLQ